MGLCQGLANIFAIGRHEYFRFLDFQDLSKEMLETRLMSNFNFTGGKINGAGQPGLTMPGLILE